jgi:hypothetical protein
MNIKIFMNTYKQFRWSKILKILGVTCGGAATIHHLDSTTYPKKFIASCSLSLDLEFKGLQQTQSVLLASAHG